MDQKEETQLLFFLYLEESLWILNFDLYEYCKYCIWNDLTDTNFWFHLGLKQLILYNVEVNNTQT